MYLIFANFIVFVGTFYLEVQGLKQEGLWSFNCIIQTMANGQNFSILMIKNSQILIMSHKRLMMKQIEKLDITKEFLANQSP